MRAVRGESTRGGTHDSNVFDRAFHGEWSFRGIRPVSVTPTHNAHTRSDKCQEEIYTVCKLVVSSLSNSEVRVLGHECLMSFGHESHRCSMNLCIKAAGQGHECLMHFGHERHMLFLKHEQLVEDLLQTSCQDKLFKL